MKATYSASPVQLVGNWWEWTITNPLGANIKCKLRSSEPLSEVEERIEKSLKKQNTFQSAFR